MLTETIIENLFIFMKDVNHFLIEVLQVNVKRIGQPNFKLKEIFDITTKGEQVLDTSPPMTKQGNSGSVEKQLDCALKIITLSEDIKIFLKKMCKYLYQIETIKVDLSTSFGIADDLDDIYTTVL